MSNQETMNAQEPLEYDVGADEQEATVELSEDGQAQLSESPAQETKEAELEEYSDRVKKRIDKLTARLRETQRREEAALAYARSVQSKAQQLEERFKQSDQERVHATKSNLETQVATLKQIIRKAREEGDIDTETEAQERLTSALYEQRRLAEIRPVQQQYQMQPQQPQYQQPQAQQYQQPQRRAPDPKAEDWAERNTWFGKDVAMTHAAQGIHIQLIKDEQFDPTSDEYYDELDRRMRENFPQKFADAPAPAPAARASRPVQTVAPASRSTGVNNARRTIKLTPSQVAIAKRLGVPLEEYAKYVKE
jgi:chromosome segregation ATPase